MIYIIIGDLQKSLVPILSTVSIMLALYFKFVYDLKIRHFVGCTSECVLGEYVGMLMAYASIAQPIEELGEENARKFKEKLEKIKEELMFLTEKYSQIHSIDLQEIIDILRGDTSTSETLSIASMTQVFRLYYLLFDLQGRIIGQRFTVIFLTSLINTLLKIFSEDETIIDKLCEVTLTINLIDGTLNITYFDVITKVIYNLVAMAYSEEYEELPVHADIKKLLKRVSNLLGDPDIHNKLKDRNFRKELIDSMKKLRRTILGIF